MSSATKKRSASDDESLPPAKRSTPVTVTMTDDRLGPFGRLTAYCDARTVDPEEHGSFDTEETVVATIAAKALELAIEEAEPNRTRLSRVTANRMVLYARRALDRMARMVASARGHPVDPAKLSEAVERSLSTVIGHVLCGAMHRLPGHPLDPVVRALLDQRCPIPSDADIDKACDEHYLGANGPLAVVAVSVLSEDEKARLKHDLSQSWDESSPADATPADPPEDTPGSYFFDRSDVEAIVTNSRIAMVHLFCNELKGYKVGFVGH